MQSSSRHDACKPMMGCKNSFCCQHGFLLFVFQGSLLWQAQEALPVCILFCLRKIYSSNNFAMLHQANRMTNCLNYIEETSEQERIVAGSKLRCSVFIRNGQKTMLCCCLIFISGYVEIFLITSWEVLQDVEEKN